MLRRYETLMFHPLSLFIGLRYSRARKSHGFVAFINLFSTLGIFLGVTALVIVSSVMNGFERELKQRILGVVPHLTVQPEQRTRMSDWQAVSSQLASPELEKKLVARLKSLNFGNRDVARTTTKWAVAFLPQ